MAVRTGYNIARIKELMNNIEECYNNLGTTVQTGWDTVAQTLKANWVGEDEQDFEGKLSARISDMYVNTYNLANSSLSTIYNLAKAWYDFQASNKLNGGTAVAVDSTFGLEEKSLTKNDKIVSATIQTIGDDVDRGLVNDSSYANIKEALETYKSSMQSKVREMIDSVTVDTAFYGEQAGGVKGFVDKVGLAMAEVVTAIKDMYDALETLADSGYTKAATEVNTEMESANSTIESKLTDLQGSRWS